MPLTSNLPERLRSHAEAASMSAAQGLLAGAVPALVTDSLLDASIRVRSEYESAKARKHAGIRGFLLQNAAVAGVSSASNDAQNINLETKTLERQRVSYVSCYGIDKISDATLSQSFRAFVNARGSPWLI